MSNKSLILVDGSSYLYRAFHAMPSLTNSSGQPTGAIYGVVNMLRKLIKEHQPDYCAVVFDPKGKTFRDDLFKAYKEHRPSMPNELSQQIQPLFSVIKAMGLPLIMVDYYEADDVIGTLAQIAKAQNFSVLISTGDKDLAQLVDANVTLINTMTNTLYDSAGVTAKFGIPPEKIIDYLALVGDSSDNIPGVPMVGPKTAVKWLNEHGSIDDIVANAASISGKIGENLRNNLEQLALSRQLTTIKLDVPLPFSCEDLILKPADESALNTLFTELEFKTWLSEVGATPPKPTTPSNYQMVLTQEQFAAWLERLKSADYFSFDTETTSLNYMQADIVGVSFAISPHEAAYVPLAHDYPDAPTQLARDNILQQLKPLLEDARPKIIGQHLKYDMNVLARYGISLNGIAFDTMLESYVQNSTASRHDMDTLALKWLGHHAISFEDVAGKGAKQISFNQVHLESATQYSAEDADITLQLHQKLWPTLSQEPALKFIFEAIEIPLIKILSTIERNGVLVDVSLLNQQSEHLAERIAALEKETFQLSGCEFNLASPKQLQEILFNKLQLPVLEKTPGGQPSTAESVLEELALTYPLPQLILEHRQLCKLKSTYTDRLPEQVDPETNRVHTSYHQANTATGRLSSSDPNLQNIPIRREEGRKIRQAFIAPAGYKLIAADYSQIELRIMAHLSADPGLLSAFSAGLDIHKATAAEVFNTPLDQVTSDQRRSAKAINFGLIYGMSAFGLAKQLGIDRYAAQHYMDIYFTRYPKVKEYMETTRETARKLGYVETVFGRRLYLPEINAQNFQRKTAAERAAINAPMQGTAADIIKRAMITIHEWLEHEPLDIKMILQVHDELVFEVKDTLVAEVIPQISTLMNHAAELKIPLVVDVGVGDNWDEAH